MKLLVFGGAGFVGSAIAKSAVARGWNVISYSRSCQPYKGPDGHSPNWVAKVRSDSIEKKVIELSGVFIFSRSIGELVMHLSQKVSRMG